LSAPDAAEGGGGLSALDALGAALDRASARLSRELFRVGVYVVLPALVVLVTADVTLRYLFDAPLQWARDVNGLLLLSSIYCALPHSWDRAYHIRMELFYNRASVVGRRRLDVLASVAGIAVFGLMGIQALRYLPFMIRTRETGEDLLLPIWPFMGVLAFCCLVMVARLFANPAASEEGHGPVTPRPVPGASADHAQPEGASTEEGP